MGFDYYIDANPIHQSDLLRPHLATKEESLPVEFLRSAVYNGAQAPINGVVQLLDKTTGAHLLPKVQFIDPCEKADFGTVRWHTQQFGAMLGVTADLLALNKGIGRASNLIAGQIENTAQNQGALALRSIGESAATGFIHNGLFRPVSDNEGNFYTARLKNAAVGAGTFATLSASGLGIKYLAEGQNNMLGTVLRSKVGATVLSGIPGGLAYAEMKSLADGNGLASGKSIGQAIYSFSVLGGAFAAGKQLVGSTNAEARLNELMKSASEAARGKAPSSINEVDIKPGTLPTSISEIGIKPGTPPTSISEIGIKPGTPPTSISEIDIKPGTPPTSISEIDIKPGTPPTSISEIGIKPGTPPTSVISETEIKPGS